MSPFRPLGSQARWRTVYDLLVKADVGDIVSYEALASLFGDLDPVEGRHRLQMAMRRAAREYLAADGRAVEAVPGTGYRVVEPEHGLVLAKQHQRKAIRAVGRGRDHVTYTDLTGVEPAMRLLFEAAAQKFAEQDETLRRLDIRQQRQQKQLRAAASGLERTADQVARLEERLAALEAERRQ